MSGIPRRHRERSFRQPASRYVELIGPPGAGKSTAIDHLGRNVRGEWNLRPDMAVLPMDAAPEGIGQVHAQLLRKRLDSLDGTLDSYRVARFAAYLSGIMINDLKAATAGCAPACPLTKASSKSASRRSSPFP